MDKVNWIKGSILLGAGLLLFGCATVEDVQILDNDLRRLQLQMNTIQSQLSGIQKSGQKDEGLKKEIAKEMASYQKKNQEEIAAQQNEIQKVKSDLSLRVETLQSEVRVISTGLEEYKDYAKRPSREIDRVKEDLAPRMKLLEEREKALTEREKLQDSQFRALEERLKGIEDRLKALDGKIATLSSKAAEPERLPPTKEASSEVKGVSTGAGDLYRDAYGAFQKGNLEVARRKFEAFLKQYPNTDLSDNAQFWIGETYYLKKDFEKAILEYEKAIAKYPEGDKIPAALLKQGLSFLELGDKTNAKSLLRRVVERYPLTEQAEVAKKRLGAIK